MFIAMNRFRTIQGEEAEFERIWAERDSHLNDVPGFIEFHFFVALRLRTIRCSSHIPHG